MALTILPYLSPRLIVVDAPTTSISVQELTDDIKDWEDDPLNLSYAKLVDTSGKQNLGGGVLVGITAELQNAQLAFEQRVGSEISGSATSTDAGGTTLTDNGSGVDFLASGSVIQKGDTVLNTSTGAVATILSVTSNSVTHFPLEDGTNNQWTSGDTYKIWNKIQCEVNGGNLVAVDENGSAISAFHPTAFTHVIRTSASSATLQEQDDIRFASYNGGVTLNPTTGTSGTTFPTGTPRQPSNNLSDALTILNTVGLTKFYIQQSMTIDTGLDFSDLQFVGLNESITVLTIDANADVTNCEFTNATVLGTLDGGSTLRNCIIGSLSFVNGIIDSCIIDGSITLGGTAEAIFKNCNSGVPGLSTPTIDMGGDGPSLIVRGWNGGLTLTNRTGSTYDSSLDFNSGQLILDSTITAGNIVVRGILQLTDNSGGTSVISSDYVTNPYTIADQVYNEATSEHVTAGTFGKALNDILQVEKGSWKIISNQLIMYESDGTTPLFTFNLLDGAGQPTSTNVVTRIKV